MTELQPLAGVRILAVEQMIAGPWATQMLARLGADVIKVERPGTGDAGRASTPAIERGDRRDGATFLRTNLNKRSVAIDVRAGADLVLELAATCDVFVQNFKAGALERYGLGYEAVRAANPRIVYASVSGFGTTTPSPYRDWPAYASVAEAMSGIYVWAQQPGQRPLVNPVGALGDIGSAMFAAMGILAALRHRDLTGEGQHVDVAMFDAMVAMADVVPAMWSLGERERQPGAIIGTFQAADGWVVLQVSREHQFERLAEVVGRPEWLADPRFATRKGWTDHLEAVIRPAVEAWMGGHDKLAVCSMLAEAGIAAGPCFDAEEVLADPHLAMRDMLVTFEEGGRTYAVPGNPVQLSNVEPPPDRPSPLLGADTDAVLGELLGRTTEEIDALRRAGVVG